jgi:hypothetical protein
MWTIHTPIKVDPSSPTPYQVMIKIEVEDENFIKKLMILSDSYNIRVGSRKKNSFLSIFSSEDLDVKIIHDNERIPNVGYLEDYLTFGHVFGFKEEIEAEEFSGKSFDELQKFITTQYDEYKSATNSKYFTLFH